MIKERGLAMEWKYNRTGMIKKAAIVFATGYILYSYFKKRR
jgi:hypothetical protein